MKKLLLLPILLISTLIAVDYDYEITPVIGYNITEGNIGLDNYGIVGGQFQYNGFNSSISPELSILYSKADYTSPSTQNSKIYRVSLNGVYDFEQLGPVVPLVKAGIGYENVKESTQGESPFMDFGVGAKIPFNDAIALKVEALYMLNHNNGVEPSRTDSNLALLAGLNIAFGEKAKIEVPKEEVIDGDDDKDGVVNSKDKCPNTPSGKVVDFQGCFIDGDDDKDGVLNSIDACPTTPAGKTVNVQGCFVDSDDDKDGVLNASDECPNTPLGKLVYNDGCPESLNLNVNFSNDSAEIDPNSFGRIKSYAKFLREHASYSTDIIGYTSNTGSNEHNLQLSQKRAIAVQQIIINEGVPAVKVRAEGRGSANPITSNDTEEGRAINRRIEAEITKDR